MIPCTLHCFVELLVKHYILYIFIIFRKCQEIRFSDCSPTTRWVQKRFTCLESCIIKIVQQIFKIEMLIHQSRAELDEKFFW